MLRIGKMTDYALLIMTYMAKEADTHLSAAFLAESLHLTTPTVSKILKILSDAGWVGSVRGAEGGYFLAHKPEAITVADIIAAMEGALAMTECCDAFRSCTLNSMCMTRDNWKKINKMVESLLARFSIADLLNPISVEGYSHGK